MAVLLLSACAPPAATPMPPMVVIQLDDGNETDYTTAYPLASARGIPLTSYIITSSIGGSGLLTWAQVKELLAAGNAVECHTHTHSRLTELTEQEIHAEMQAVNAAFETEGLSTPRHHCYPGGASNETVRAIVSEYRDTGVARAGTEIITHWEQTLDWMFLGRYAIHKLTVQDVKDLIDDAIENSEVLILFTHKVTDDPTQLDTHVDDFEDLLDYIVSKGDAIEAVTIDTVYKMMQEYKNPSCR